MFSHLIESRPQRTRRKESLAASVLFHAAVAVIVVVGTAGAGSGEGESVQLSDSGLTEGTIAELVLPTARAPVPVMLGWGGGPRPEWVGHQTSWITARVVVDVLIDASGRPDTSTLVVVSADDPAYIAAAKAELPRQTIAPPPGGGPRMPEVVRLKIDFIGK